MAELIAALAEGLAALFEILLHVAAVLITVVAYLVSPKFRARKQEEWKARPRKKYRDVAISSLCCAAVIAFSLWLVLPDRKKPGTVNDFTLAEGKKGEAMRVVIQNGSNRFGFAVRHGGITNILGTKTFGELSNAIRQNVTLLEAGSKTSSNAGRVGTERSRR